MRSVFKFQRKRRNKCKTQGKKSHDSQVDLVDVYIKI